MLQEILLGTNKLLSTVFVSRHALYFVAKQEFRFFQHKVINLIRSRSLKITQGSATYRAPIRNLPLTTFCYGEMLSIAWKVCDSYESLVNRLQEF